MVNSIHLMLKNLKEQKEEFWNITKFQGYILSKIVKLYKPQNVLELGTSNGYSTLWLLLNLDINSKLTTIEIDEKRFTIAKDNFEKLDLNVNCMKDNSISFLQNTQENYDFIFVDSNHKEFKKILEMILNRKIMKNGVIIFDNIVSHKRDEFLDYVKINFKCFLIKEGGGFLVVKI